MNWILLYTLSFLAIIIVLTVGYFMQSQSSSCFKHYHDNETKKGITARELSEILSHHYKLRNTAITILKAKKSNYFSAKYNVIKFSPETAYSPYLFDLAISSKCTNQAKKQQYNYISSAFLGILSFICKMITILFIPIILIFSIINISLGLETLAYTTILISLVCYAAAFLIQIILFVLLQNSTKKVKKDLKDLELFDEEEIESIYNLILALNKYNLFTHTRLSLCMFSFVNPTAFVNRR